MKRIVRQNWFFIILILGLGVLFLRRYSYQEMPVVSNPDSIISFSTEDKELEQTWQSMVKQVTAVSIPYKAENDFFAKIELLFLSDDGNTVLASAVQEKAFQSGEEGSLSFSLGKVKLIQGNRYRIRIQFLEPDGSGVLKLASGANYGGGTLNGEETGQAAAFTITYGKASRLFWLAAVMLPLLGFSLFGMTLTKRKWEEIVGISLFAEGIILYLFGCLGRLEWGVYAVYLFAVAGIFAGIWLYNKKNMELKDLLSPGLWIYLVFFIVILICDKGDWLGMRDELRHWETAVRDMFYFDSFANHEGSTLILPRYLPFAASIEYVFEYMNGIFSEDILLISYHTMLLSAGIILCRPLQKKVTGSLGAAVLAGMVCLPVIFFPNISGSIMVDSLMAMIMAYALICYYSDEFTWFNGIRIVGALAALTLIKETGLVFAGMTAFIIFVDMLAVQIKNRKLAVKRLLFPIGCVVMILGLFVSWQVYLSAPAAALSQNEIENAVEEYAEDEGTTKDEAAAMVSEENIAEEQIVSAVGTSNITIEGLKKLLSGEGEVYQYKTTQNLLTELFDGETYSFGNVSFSFFDLLLAVVFLLLTLVYFHYWKEKGYRICIFSAGICLASLMLCVFIQLVYWFSFSMYEAMDLTSLGRYLAPYLCAVMITAFYLIYEEFSETAFKRKKVNYLIFAGAFLLMICMPVEGIVVEPKDREGYTTEEITYGHDEIAEILRSVADKGEKAYFICSNSDGYSEYIFRNKACPVVSEHSYWNIVGSEEIYAEQEQIYGKENLDDNIAAVLSPEAWEEKLKECEYAVVFHADELFARSYEGLFEKPEEMGDGSVYQIVKEDEQVFLRRIGQTGIKGWH